LWIEHNLSHCKTWLRFWRLFLFATLIRGDPISAHKSWTLNPAAFSVTNRAVIASEKHLLLFFFPSTLSPYFRVVNSASRKSSDIFNVSSQTIELPRPIRVQKLAEAQKSSVFASGEPIICDFKGNIVSFLKTGEYFEVSIHLILEQRELT